MELANFVILLVISAVVAAILHYGMRYRVDPSLGSYLAKVVWGYFGARLGTWAFGRWWDGLNYGDIFFLPAILGSIAILIVGVDLFQTAARDSRGRRN